VFICTFSFFPVKVQVAEACATVNSSGGAGG